MIFPIKAIEHLPNCIQIRGKKINKEILFCFASEQLIEPWMSAVETFKFCRKGIDPIMLAAKEKEAK